MATLNIYKGILEERLRQGRDSLVAIKNKSLSHNKMVEALINTTVNKIASLLKADINADYSPIIEYFKRQLQDIVQQDIDYAINNALIREDADRDFFMPLLRLSNKWCNIDSYTDTIEHYANILSSEVSYFLGLGLSIDMLGLYLANPEVFIVSKGMDISAFRQGIYQVNKGVSYVTMKNLKKIGISSLMLSYNNAMAELWKNSGEIYGYIGFRNSGYPCMLCDEQAGRLMPIEDMVYPLHNNCVCAIVYVRNDEII